MAEITDAKKSPPKRGMFLAALGPRLITGASDDDPSGIATYSQAGAQFGYSLGWTLLLSYPLMAAIQLISARIGSVTGRGIAGNIAPLPALAALSPGRAMSRGGAWRSSRRYRRDDE